MGKRYAALDVGRFKHALADFQQMLVSGEMDLTVSVTGSF